MPSQHTSARRAIGVAVCHAPTVACTNGGLHQRWLDVHPAWQAHHIVAAQLRLTEELQRRRAHEMEEAKVRGRGRLGVGVGVGVRGRGRG